MRRCHFNATYSSNGGVDFWNWHSAYADGNFLESEMMFIGVDSGVHGAIAVLSNKHLVGIWDAPLDDTNAYRLGRYNLFKTANLIRDIKKGAAGPHGTVVEACIERINSMPGSGVHNAFLQGEGFMMWKAMFVAMGIFPMIVNSQAWRQAFFKPTEKDERKAQSIALARKLYPASKALIQLAKHDGRAEALLIAEFARRAFKARSSV